MFKKPYTDEELRTILLSGSKEELAIAEKRLVKHSLVKLGTQLLVAAAVITTVIVVTNKIATETEIED